MRHAAFIARTRRLSCRAELYAAGFPSTHFGGAPTPGDLHRVHCSTWPQAPSTEARLSSGETVIVYRIPASALQGLTFGLTARPCRARPTADAAGEVVEDPARQVEFLRLQILRKPIEVLVRGPVPLPWETSVLTFSSADARPVHRVLRACGLPWAVEYCRPRVRYDPLPEVREADRAFLERCVREPGWLGND